MVCTYIQECVYLTTLGNFKFIFTVVKAKKHHLKEHQQGYLEELKSRRSAWETQMWPYIYDKSMNVYIILVIPYLTYLINPEIHTFRSPDESRPITIKLTRCYWSWLVRPDQYSLPAIQICTTHPHFPHCWMHFYQIFQWDKYSVVQKCFPPFWNSRLISGAKWPAHAQPIGPDGTCVTKLSSINFARPCTAWWKGFLHVLSPTH